MARALSEEKRKTICDTAKRLFAEHGFGNASVADIAVAASVPVGSIYTYFSSKEDLICTIVEEGWADFRERLQQSFKETDDPAQRFRLLLDSFLPELLADVEFIQILLSEGVAYTRIEKKTGELSGIIGGLLQPLVSGSGNLRDFTPKDLEAALLVYFLGVLNAVRICQVAELDLTSTDVLAFLRRSIQNGLGLEL